MMMRVFTLTDLSAEEAKALCRRPHFGKASVDAAVLPIIDAVKNEGDAAVREWNARFGIHSGAVYLPLAHVELPRLPEEVSEAIDLAMQNIRRFHEAQIRPRLTVETMEGVTCFREFRPVERVGLYVPGGTAVLPSTAMMLCIPAMLAGCKTTVLATPPDANGKVSDEILYIAKKCSLSGILLSGGAQAITALAYGTETVPKVDKIFGPGNQFVTATKTHLANSDANISIDMPAGPSEVLIIADETAVPEFVAADLLSQAEHGADSQVVLILTDEKLLQPVLQSIKDQLELTGRKEFAGQSLRNGFILLANNVEEAVQFSNLYAPEHLILAVDHPVSRVESIQNAGSVFLGNWTPESAGDYASGTNHTLPTGGYARQYGGVSTESFGKYITFQSITPAGIANIGGAVQKLAAIEGLDAHARAIEIRLNKL